MQLEAYVQYLSKASDNQMLMWQMLEICFIQNELQIIALKKKGKIVIYKKNYLKPFPISKPIQCHFYKNTKY